MVVALNLDAHIFFINIYRSSSPWCNTVLSQLEVDEGRGGGGGNGDCLIALICQGGNDTIRLCQRNLIDSSPFMCVHSSYIQFSLPAEYVAVQKLVRDSVLLELGQMSRLTTEAFITSLSEGSLIRTHGQWIEVLQVEWRGAFHLIKAGLWIQ